MYLVAQANERKLTCVKYQKIWTEWLRMMGNDQREFNSAVCSYCLLTVVSKRLPPILLSLSLSLLSFRHFSPARLAIRKQIKREECNRQNMQTNWDTRGKSASTLAQCKKRADKSREYQRWPEEQASSAIKYPLPQLIFIPVQSCILLSPSLLHFLQWPQT